MSDPIYEAQAYEIAKMARSISALEAENAKLRELLSMYMTFARTAARGLCIQSAHADGMGRKLDEAEMRERAMELGIEWCR